MTRSTVLYALACIPAMLSASGCNAPSASPRPPIAPTSPPVASAPAAASTPARPPAIGMLARFDFVITVVEEGKPDNIATYTLNLEENHAGELMMGTNVPLSSSPVAKPSHPPMSNKISSKHADSEAGQVPDRAPRARQDVGLRIKGVFQSRGEGLLLRTSFESSALEAPSSIRKVVVHSDTLIVPGKPTDVAVLESGSSHQRYRITVTATPFLPPSS